MTNSSPNQMTFLEHIQDLRKHIIFIIVGVFIASVVAFVFGSKICDNIILWPKESDFFTNRLFWFLSDLFSIPGLKINQNVMTITNFELAGQFNAHISIAIYSGIIISSPNTIYQIWSFIKPALHKPEEKSSKTVLFSSILLFLMGSLFAYFIITPLTIHFFYNYSVSDLLINQIRLVSYVNSISWMIFGTGILFQMPIVLYVLTKYGIVSFDTIERQRRYVIIIIFVVAAIITPPDIISLILVSLPIYLLFEMTLLLLSWQKINDANRVSSKS